MPVPMPFTAQAMQIGQLLANPHVIEAPPYQRSFAWSEVEAGQLLDDVSSAMDEGKSPRNGSHYFLGTMLFLRRERSASRLNWPSNRVTQSLEVVDGFQRLTTLTILFSVLRDLDGDGRGGLTMAIGNGKGAKALHRLTLKGPDEAFFHAHVRAPGATRIVTEDNGSSPTTARILAVRNHFSAVLTDLDAAERRKLADFLLESCYVVHVATTDIDRAHHMFMVLNARGKPLARNDILKAELLGHVPSTARDSATEIWDEAAGRLGGGFEQLFSHVRSMYGRYDDHVIGGIGKITAEKGGAQAFIERILRPSARILDDIHKARHHDRPQSTAINGLLRYLGWHSFSDWIPPAMLWWFERGDDTEGFLKFLGSLDRLAFGVRILGIGGPKRARRFGSVVTAIREGRALDGPESPLEFPRPELKVIQHNLRDLHARNAAAAKHLLFRLTEHQTGAPLLPVFPGNMTVEHVLPRKLPPNSPWRPWYQDPEVRGSCTECLGNLVLVTKEQNDRASNLDLPRKLGIYFNTPDVPIPSINEDLRGRTEWTPAQIREREAKLMQLIEEVWRFGLAELNVPAPDPTPPKSKRGVQSKKP